MDFFEKNKIIVWLIIVLISLSSVIAASPTVDVIYITPDDSGDLGVQVAPNAGTTKTITITTEVTDLDGVSDIKNVKAVTPIGVITLNKVQDIDTDSAEYSNNFNMNFYDAPVTYPINVTAEDNDENKGSDTDEFDYLESINLELDSSTINFLNVNPGSSSVVAGDNNMLSLNNPTIQNYGNTIIDAEISGTDLSYGLNNILVNNVQYSFVDQDWNNALAGVLGYVNERKNIGLYYSSMETNEVSYRLSVPSSTSAGDYSGTVTITAVKGTGNRAPVLHYIEDITVVERELVKIIPNATDLDGDILTFTFTAPLDSNGEWQTELGDEGVYTVTVTVSDGILYDSQNVTITVLSAIISRNISLYVGWNLISMPLNLTNKTLDAPLKSIEGNYSKVMAYDKVNGWKVYDPNDIPHSNLVSIEDTIGIWIRMTNMDTLVVNGLEFSAVNFNLKQGYNLISYPSLDDNTVGYVFGDVISDVENVLTYENNVWKSYNPNKTEHNTLTTVKSGQGYWVKVSNDVSWSFSSGKFS